MPNGAVISMGKQQARALRTFLAATVATLPTDEGGGGGVDLNELAKLMTAEEALHLIQLMHRLGRLQLE